MKLFLLSFCCILFLQPFAQKGATNTFYKPKPLKFTPVNDYAGILTKEENKLLSQKLLQYRDTSTNVLVVITQKTLKDNSSGETYGLEEAAKHYFNNWGIGVKGKNNGVLFFVVKDDRKIRIATGAGIDDILTDYVCQDIIDGSIVPQFKNKQYYQGLADAADKVMLTLSPEIYGTVNEAATDVAPTGNTTEYSFASETTSREGNSSVPYLIFLAVAVVIIFIISTILALRSGRNTVYDATGSYNNSFTQRSRGPWFSNGWFFNNFFNNNPANAAGYHHHTIYQNNDSGFSNSSSFDTGSSSSFSAADNSSSSSSDSGSSFGGGSSDGGGASGSW